MLLTLKRLKGGEIICSHLPRSGLAISETSFANLIRSPLISCRVEQIILCASITQPPFSACLTKTPELLLTIHSLGSVLVNVIPEDHIILFSLESVRGNTSTVRVERIALKCPSRVCSNVAFNKICSWLVREIGGVLTQHWPIIRKAMHCAEVIIQWSSTGKDTFTSSSDFPRNCSTASSIKDDSVKTLTWVEACSHQFN